MEALLVCVSRLTAWRGDLRSCRLEARFLSIELGNPYSILKKSLPLAPPTCLTIGNGLGVGALPRSPRAGKNLLGSAYIVAEGFAVSPGASRLAELPGCLSIGQGSQVHGEGRFARSALLSG